MQQSNQLLLIAGHTYLVDPTPRAADSDATFIRRVLWVLLLIGLGWLLVQLSDLLLLAFGAVLVAVIFHALAEPIARITRLPERWALLVAMFLVFTVIALSGWLFGAQIGAQFDELQQTLPRAWATFEKWLSATALGDRLLTAARDWAPSGSGLARNVGSVAAATVGAVVNLLLVVVAGIYIAAQPRIYRSGLVQLVPPRSRDASRDAVAATGRALRSWLRAQLLGMVAIGVLTTAGLWLIGMPSALALGLLAGLAEFVPILGPLIAAVPALLIALTLGTDTVLWTLGLYVLIQQIEGNIIMPIVTRQAVELPPALALFSVVALGVLFGPLGVLFGAPLAVVLFVLVRELYVKRTLGEAPPAPPRKD
ncbi:MAG: AI-2E family transporter [Pseudomonadota bacterium]|nr:AI-2E family transporter [Pseudomonadota bacterium]